jgi:hypothetical protein
MTDPLATTVILDIRVERSAKPMACDTCGLRRITYAIVLQPLLLPARWRCADCAGIRIPTLSGDPRPLAGDPVLWPEDPADFPGLAGPEEA